MRQHQRPSADPYDDLAEFHDLFMHEPWGRLRPAVRAVVGHCGPQSVVVEIGAGSGVGTRVIASECRAEIMALEPNPTMRAMLLSRVASDPDLSGRVTVLAGAAPVGLGELPARVEAAVVAHVLGHLTEQQRLSTWADLAARLSSGARVLVTVGGDQQSRATDPGEVVETRRLGRHTYTARHQDSPTDDGCSTFKSLYQVHDGDRLLRERAVAGSWVGLDLAAVRREAGASGLVTTELGPGLAVVRAP